MDYIIAIFLLGLIVTFIVVVGLARAAEFAHTESAHRLEIDPLPPEWAELTLNRQDAATRHRSTQQ